MRERQPVAGRAPAGPVPVVSASSGSVAGAASSGAGEGSGSERAYPAAVLMAAFEATPDAVFAVDLSGRVIAYNTMCATLWDYSPEMLARNDYVELTGHAALKMKDVESFRARTRNLLDGVLEHTIDQMELIDGRIFDRAVSPLRIDGKIAGTLVCWRDVTVATRLSRQLTQQAHQQSTVARLSRAALAGADLRMLKQQAAESVLACLDVDSCQIFRLELSGLRAQVVASAGVEIGEGEGELFATPPESGFTSVLATGDPIICEDLAGETRFAVSPRILAQGFASGIGIGVPGYHALRSVISAYSLTPRKFSELDASFLRSIAHVLAEASRRLDVEATLRISEQGLADAQRMAGLGNWELELASGNVRCSDELYRIFGAEPGAFSSNLEAFLARLHPEDRDGVRSKLAEAVANDTHYDAMLRIVRPGGTLVYAHAMGEVLRGPDREPIGLFGTLLDVTERVQADVAVRDSEERFRALANAMPQLAAIAGADGQLQWFNQRWCDYTGFDADATDVATWGRALPVDSLALVSGAWRAAVASGEQFETEVDIRGHDGIARPFLIRASPASDSSGNVVRWFGTATDVSALKQSEALLKTSEERLKVALAAAGAVAFSWDVRADEWTRYYSVEPSLPVNLDTPEKLEQVLSRIEPDQRDAFRENLKSAIQGDGSYRNVYRLQRPDGGERWLEERGQLERSDTGEPIRLNGVAIDVTRRQQASDALREASSRLGLALESAQLGTFDIRPLVGEVIADERLATMLGDSSQRVLKIEDTLALVHPADRAALEEDAARLFRGTGSDYLVEYRIVTADGAVHWCVDRGRIFRSPGRGRRDALRVVGVHADVTQRERDKLALQAQAEALGRANADLSRFAEVSAHHLMEPARRLGSYSQRLKQRLAVLLPAHGDGDLALTIATLDQESQRVRSLVRDIQRYLNAAAPRGIVQPESSLAMVEALRDRLHATLIAQGVQLDIGALPDVMLDRPRLSDLFSAVLDNALRHGMPILPGETARIQVSGEREGAMSRFRVRDNGPGIPLAYRERVFGIFERLGSSTSVDSTGIGLSLARRIVESRGGRIWIGPSPDGGTEVVFEIPDGELA